MSIETEAHQSIQTTLKPFKSTTKPTPKSSITTTTNPTPQINGHKPSSKPSKWIKQKAKRKRRKQRKKQRKILIHAQERKLVETKSLLHESQTLLNEIEYISDTLTETAKNNFQAAFERFTPAEDLFKTKEELLRQAADREKLKKQQEKEEKEKLRREDPIEAAIPDESKKNKNKNSKSDAANSEILSNKKRKMKQRPNIAQLKKSVIRSDLVEEHDVNAPNPWLLIELKSMRNTVPVPAHWLQKRKYLQGKRGFLKPAFKLPPYIEATGITKMRESRLNLLSDKSMKQKQREKMRPKKGGLEISYKILHEAFFTHQTKPDNLTTFGDLYFEGKEFQMKFRKFKPGFISDNLKKALTMTPRYRVVSPAGVMVRNKRDNEESGDIEWYDVQQLKYGQYVVWDQHCGPKRIRISAPVSGYVWLSSKDGKEELLKRCDVEDPPPWLINMQRFGPPPSYGDLKIPGLNAPIPTHKMYGFHEGQWGKPPVDENGQPLYGDPFGIWTEPISKSWGAKSRWGVLQKFESDSESDSDSEDDDGEEVDGDMSDVNKCMDMDVDMSGIVSSDVMSGISSAPSQIHLNKSAVVNSYLTGIETPTSGVSTQELRLRNMNEDGDVGNGKELYQVLEARENVVRGKFGSSMVYEMPGEKRKNGGGDGGNEPPVKKRRKG